jgi:hypothetical protein
MFARSVGISGLGAVEEGMTMNTIGKILVVLNLIFALVVGGFLVIDFATRTNWKTAYEKLKDEMLVAGTNTNESGRTLQQLNTQVKRAVAEREEWKQKLIDQETVAKVERESHKRMTDELIDKAKDADLNSQKAIAERDRLTKEVELLSGTVQNRDNVILALQKDNKQYRTEASAMKDLSEATQRRNVDLLAQIQDLLRKIALRDAGVGSENKLAKDPNAPNPPSNYVKGKIDRVDPKDRTLVQISLGTDQGLKLDHTLEVYRVDPPQYLGRIRIVDAKEHAAAGKLTTGNRIPLQVGDIVASSLNNQSR